VIGLAGERITLAEAMEEKGYNLLAGKSHVRTEEGFLSLKDHGFPKINEGRVGNKGRSYWRNIFDLGIIQITTKVVR